jgi:hypothetical protein
MHFLRKYTDPHKASFLILILPYLGIISVDYFISPVTSFNITILIGSAILIVNYLYSSILEPIKNKIITNSIVNGFVLIILYGEILIEKINKIIEKLPTNLHINQWVIIIIILIISILKQILIFKKNIEIVRVIKTYFIIFSITMVFYKINQNKHFFNISTKETKNIKIKNFDVKKPVILIITDGYVSPDEFYRLYMDSSIYSFSENLKKTGWIVRNSSRSEEITTIHSLSSIFNFNFLVQNKKDVSSTFWGQHLIESKLVKHLNAQNVQIYNYGILDIGAIKRFTPIYYYYPTTGIGQFFDKSMINIKYFYNDSGLQKRQFEHNKFILEDFPKQINSNSKVNSFYYVHLLMPHDPYLYSNQFKNTKESNPDKYFEFWKFTNDKLEKLLFQLTKEDKYRIILTGDHGYGNIGGGVKAENTFTAFYGFDSLSLSKINTVQDLGILIDRSFK